MTDTVEALHDTDEVMLAASTARATKHPLCGRVQQSKGDVAQAVPTTFECPAISPSQGGIKVVAAICRTNTSSPRQVLHHDRATTGAIPLQKTVAVGFTFPPVLKIPTLALFLSLQVPKMKIQVPKMKNPARELLTPVPKMALQVPEMKKQVPKTSLQVPPTQTWHENCQPQVPGKPLQVPILEIRLSDRGHGLQIRPGTWFTLTGDPG